SAGTVRRFHLSKEGTKLLFGRFQRDVVGAAEHTGEHPQHIAVDGGHRQIEGDGGDGAGGIIADAWQSAQLLKVCGKFCIILLNQHAGSLLQIDRKSTRLNSSHVSISYAVFCLKKKKIK